MVDTLIHFNVEPESLFLYHQVPLVEENNMSLVVIPIVRFNNGGTANINFKSFELNWETYAGVLTILRYKV